MSNDSDVKAVFGKRIRVLRLERGWSQEEFAQNCGLDRSYVGGVERGQRNISLENIHVIADALEVSLSQLFSFDCSKPIGSRTKGTRR